MYLSSFFDVLMTVYECFGKYLKTSQKPGSKSAHYNANLISKSLRRW